MVVVETWGLLTTTVVVVVGGGAMTVVVAVGGGATTVVVVVVAVGCPIRTGFVILGTGITTFEPQLPKGTPFPVPVTWRPGLGKVISTPSAVVQVSAPMFLMFALRISGRELKKVLLPAEPVIFTGAHLIYISRLPILLNQVHATTASPAGRSDGTLNGRVCLPEESKLPVVEPAGQFPWKDLMTLKTEALVGGLSYVIEIWQDPPPWIAEPSNVIA